MCDERQFYVTTPHFITFCTHLTLFTTQRMYECCMILIIKGNDIPEQQ